MKTLEPSPAATDRLRRVLDELERTLDPADESERERLHLQALRYEPVDRLPVVVMCSEPLPAERAPYPLAEAVCDPAKMLFNELVSAWDTSIVRRAEIGDDLPATVRANFGTGLVASCFGATIDQPENDPAWVRHFESDAEFDRAIAAPPDFASEWVERALATMTFYRTTLSSYRRLQSVLKITVPDLQGPLDNAAMLRGSELFVDIIADSERFRTALEAMTLAQIELWRRFAPLSRNEPNGFVHQHGVLVKGSLLLRNDSSVMLSPEMYRDEVGPWDERVLSGVGGGAIHSCGRIDHVIPHYLEHESIRCIDFGQSWMNDVDAAYRLASQQKVPLVRVRADRDELESGSILDRFPTGVVLVHQTDSVAGARETMGRYRDAAHQRAGRSVRASEERE